MREYRYNLIRYVPDAARMEPVNVGVILQGAGQVDVKFYPHAGKLSAVDAEQFQKWRQFFVAEIQTEQVQLFQPDRNTKDFLRYLEALCNGPVYLSHPLVAVVDDNEPFESLLNHLYVRLVAPPDAPVPGEEKRPTGLFRRVENDRNFLERGMKRYAHVVVDSQSLWAAYRQVDNGQVIAMDKVEAGRELGKTQNEIDRLYLVTEKLSAFIGGKVKGKETAYYLLMDELTVPFNGQSTADFDWMRRELDLRAKQVQDRGGHVLRSLDEVNALTKDIDKRLPSLRAVNLSR